MNKQDFQRLGLIVIPTNTVLLKKLTYEFNHVGYGIYFQFLRLVGVTDDFKLILNDTNIGIMAESLRISTEQLDEMIAGAVKEGIFNKKEYKKGYLYCKEIADILLITDWEL